MVIWQLATFVFKCVLKVCLCDCQLFVGLMEIPSTPLKYLAGVLQTELPWQHRDLARQDIFACLSKGDKLFRASNGYFFKMNWA